MRTTIHIFIASSNELKEEREKCIPIIHHLNKSHRHLALEPILWEYEMVSGSYYKYKNIQDAINPKLKQSHLAVFMFYSKLGKYTREEFEYSNAEKKKLFAFFKSGFSPDRGSIKSFDKLLAFKESLNDNVLYENFTGLGEFEKLLYRSLNQYLSETYPIGKVATTGETINALSQSNLHLIKALNAKEQEIKKLRNKLERSPAKNSQDRLTRLMEEKDAISRELAKSEDVIKQQAKDKADLQRQLTTQKGKDKLKAKALREIEKENYSRAEEYLKESARESIEETATTFYELGKIKKLQLQYKDSFYYYELAAKIEPLNILYLNDAGMMAYQLGLYVKAIAYLKKSLTLSIEKYGKEHTNVAICYHYLGLIHTIKSEYDKAIRYFNKALVIDKKFYGKEYPAVATHYGKLAIAYMFAGHNDTAIDYYGKAIAIGKKFYGEDHPEMANFYNDMGLSYHYKGEYDTAIAYQTKALAIDRKFHGEAHPHMAFRLNNLGLAYNEKGEYQKAIRWLNKALAMDKKIYEGDHPSMATVYSNLGNSYRYMGNYDRSIRYFEKALEIDLKFFGEEHLDTVTNLNNLGLVHWDNAEYDKGFECLNRALSLAVKFYLDNHPIVATCHCNVGMIFSDMCRHNEALRHFNKALEIDKRFSGEQHPDVATDYNNIAMTYESKGNTKRAIATFEKSIAILLKFHPANHPNVKEVERNLAALLRKMKRKKKTK